MSRTVIVRTTRAWRIGSMLACAFAVPALAAAPAAAVDPAQAFAGCYDVQLTQTHAAGANPRSALRRRVEFFAELVTQARPDDGGRVVRENRSSGFGRLFKQAQWQPLDARRFRVTFSDGAENWTATLTRSGKAFSGTATYAGDPNPAATPWTATATAYTCRR